MHNTVVDRGDRLQRRQPQGAGGNGPLGAVTQGVHCGLEHFAAFAGNGHQSGRHGCPGCCGKLQ